MGKRDLDLKSYLSDKRRYADIYNGSMFHGGQLLKPEELDPGESGDGGLQHAGAHHVKGSSGVRQTGKGTET